jgi:hypothetical protein
VSLRFGVVTFFAHLRWWWRWRQVLPLSYVMHVWWLRGRYMEVRS